MYFFLSIWAQTINIWVKRVIFVNWRHEDWKTVSNFPNLPYLAQYRNFHSMLLFYEANRGHLTVTLLLVVVVVGATNQSLR